MSLSKGFPFTFNGTNVTNACLKAHDSELSKIYTDINSIMSTHAHTNSGSDGAVILASSISNTPAGNISSTTVQTAINELDTEKLRNTLVSEILVTGSAVTSVNFTSLDGNADYGYVLVSEINNTTASLSTNSISFNGDTTAGHYLSEDAYISSGAGVATSIVYPKLLSNVAASNLCTSFANINISVNGNIAWAAQNTSTSNYTEYVTGFKTTTETNITSITITASVASAIGIGSRFRLYRRK